MRNAKQTSSERGAALVELAIVLPLFLLPLLVGIIEVGLLLYNQQVLTNSSREGARAGIARIAKDGLGIDFVLNQGHIDDIIDKYCDDRMVTFAAKPDPNTTVDGLGGAPGQPLVVTTKVDYTFLAPSLLGFGTSMQLTAETTMDMELSL